MPAPFSDTMPRIAQIDRMGRSQFVILSIREIL
jgi:hypothetical protein